MAIAFDATTDGGNNSGLNNSLSWTHTFGNITNGVCFVALVGDVIAGNNDITSVTCNGVGATLIRSQTATAARFFYLYEAPVGTVNGGKTIAVSCTNNHYLIAGSTSYSGATQSAPEASNINYQSGNSVTRSITTITDNAWVIMAAGTAAFQTPTAGTGATRRVVDATFGEWALFDGNAAVTPPASTSMTWTTVGGSTDQTTIMVSLQPPGAAVTAIYGTSRLLTGAGT